MSHICPSCWTDHNPRSYLTNLPPVSSHNIEQMRETLEPFLNQPPNTLREVVVLCPESIITVVRHEMQWPFSKKTCLYVLTRRYLPKPLLHDVGAAAQKVPPAQRHIGPSTPQNPLTCHSSHRAAPGSSGIPILLNELPFRVLVSESTNVLDGTSTMLRVAITLLTHCATTLSFDERKWSVLLSHPHPLTNTPQ